MRDFEEEARIVRELTRGDDGPDPFSSAVRATRMPMVITNPLLPDNPIVFVNRAFISLTGFERSEVIGRNCRFLQGPRTDKSQVARMREAITSRVPIELDLLNYRKNGTHFWNRLLVSPVFADDGNLLYYFASQFDVTLERERLAALQRDRDDLEAEVVRRTAELRAAEQRLQFALEAGRLGSWSINLGTQELTASDECKKICGRLPADSLTLEELRDSIHPDDRIVQIEAIEHAITNRSLLDVEYRIRTPKGEERWVQIRGQATYRADGAPLTILGTTQDVTNRREAEEHRTLLANELSHRVKNTLASLQAIVAQTMRRAPSVAAAGVTLEARIQAMAAANDLLISQKFEGATMRALLERTLSPFGVEDKDRFTLTGPDVKLPARLVVAFALAIHELATNATKYGALSNADGMIGLSWEVVHDPHPQSLQLHWVESGGPRVIPPSRTSFGTQLIQRMLPREIDGSVEVDYPAEGLVFKAIAPLIDTAENDNNTEFATNDKRI
ncbi:PAS domain-containing protein [Novosphingobium sp. AP12]|uniref:PAS domain-containing protein n=1 Tax=Novosphingobium sp. AP12 TaxID=1144305 RepID=UPI0012F92407|nr:PAS domain-containing protein [Novosphingobium sp. AP12]